ncbi:MAG: helix-hairpin-helix domain-containing protein [Lentimicrobiaceae bacterium]
MKQHIKDYLSFTKSERNGILILLSLIIIVLFIPRFFVADKKPEEVSSELYKIEIEKFLKDDRVNESYENKWQEDKSSGRKVSRFNPVVFNPNRLDKDGWVKMGFSPKQADVIIKYRSKGGHFTKKEDFKKLFIIDDEVYRIFEPYITIDEKDRIVDKRFDAVVNKSDLSKYTGSNVYKVEINSADSIELLKIRGIGPTFARRIIKYRDKLGGYSGIAQLAEVYGMDSTRFSSIMDQVIVDTSLVSVININTATLGELRLHPYIDYYMAKAIMDKRIQQGGFKSVEDLKTIALINQNKYRRLKPYLSIR